MEQGEDAKSCSVQETSLKSFLGYLSAWLYQKSGLERQVEGLFWQIGNQIIPQSYSDRELYSLQCGEGKQEDRWKNC